MPSIQRLIFLAIGSELLSGDVLESNAHWLQNKIKSKDVEMVKIEIIEDCLETVVHSIQSATDEADYVIISGGLGPTDDDLTREAVSKAINQPLTFNPDSWQDIQTIFHQRGKVPGKSNEKQALHPTGSHVLKNPKGTAPGFCADFNNSVIMTFPGVPSEFYHMAELHLLPRFKSHASPAHFKLWGIGESSLMDTIQSKQLIPPDMPWGTIARKEGLSLRFTNHALTHPEYSQTLKKVKTVFKDYIYTENDLTPVEILFHDAKELPYTLGLAESCTGGLISEMITRIPGSSSVFNGGVVAYQNEIKENLLNVPGKVLENHGAVSPECVEAMAIGCTKLLQADMGMAVSGIAGPGGGTEYKPVGTVYIAAHYKGVTKSKHLELHGSRDDIRERSAYALCLLAFNLRRGHE